MKNHLVIQLREEVPQPLPYWEEIIADKSKAKTGLNTRVDQLLSAQNLPVWATSEYARKGDRWTASEQASGLNRTYRLIVQNRRVIPHGLLEQLQALPEVEKVHAGQLREIPLPQPYAVAQSQHTGIQPYETIGVSEGHQRFTTGDPSVKVAVLDTGVNLSHPELQHALVAGYDFVDVLGGTEAFYGDATGVDDDPEDDLAGHGTHVAGIVAARGMAMPKGVAPACKIMPVRVLGTVKSQGKYVGAGLVDNINAGIKWAVDHGADVINMSLGITHEGGGLPHEDAIRYASENGVTVVAASGNDGQSNLYYPGALPHVIAVGATDPGPAIAPYSTYGKVTVCAPGSQIYSAGIKGGYAFASGTSQAAPFVSGLVALLKSLARKKGRELRDNQVQHILQQTADRPGKTMKDQRWGFGQINVPDALTLLEHKLQKH